MGVRKEFETLKLSIEADKAILTTVVSDQEAKGPLGFIDHLLTRHSPAVFGAILTAAMTYLYERLVTGNSPEEIAARSESLIRTYSK